MKFQSPDLRLRVDRLIDSFVFLEFATAELGEALAETRTDFVRRVRVKVVPSLLRGERHALVYPITPTSL
jgi:hypothetical protein